MKACTWLSGIAPMKPSSGWPSLKAITAGIDWMPSWPGICGWSSMFILTSLTLPLAAFTTFSRTGVSCLQGPHHGAQKSTRTGTLRDASITSARKSLVVVSLMRSAAAAGAAPFPPCPMMRFSALMAAPNRLVRRLCGGFSPAFQCLTPPNPRRRRRGRPARARYGGGRSENPRGGYWSWRCFRAGGN